MNNNVSLNLSWRSPCTSSASSVKSFSSTRSNSSRSKCAMMGNNEIRSRLLNKLGIFGGPSATTAKSPAIWRRNRVVAVSEGVHHVDHGARKVSCRPNLKDIVPFRVPLKYSTGDAVSLPNKVKKKVQRKEKRCIVFNNDVSVVPIPMRNEYSSRVRHRLWSNRFEIHENAARNSLEFLAEGCNWRTVTEDEGMYVCSASGELIHPVHCQVYYVQQQQQQVGRAQEHPPSFSPLTRGAPAQNAY